MVSAPVSAAQLGAGTHPMSIDTRELRPGAYALRMITEQGVRSTQFLIVR
jgi:hypothetical protein